MSVQQIHDKILIDYSAGDFPCLAEQYSEFKLNKPLLGLNVLHATPIFKNFLPKILPLAASGANLFIVPPPGLPYDQDIFNFLGSNGFRVMTTAPTEIQYDIVYDCMGSHAHCNSKFGYVELTQSGNDRYKNSTKTCIQVDDSKIKLLEDLLGTSESILRVFKSINFDVSGKQIALFGYGKVGQGLYRRLLHAGANITVIEKDIGVAKHLPKSIAFSDKRRIIDCLSESDVIITATGSKEVFSELAPETFMEKKKILLNMGAGDEFGDKFKDEMIVNNKRPANFSLSEPTLLKYLDATFAMHNGSGVDLINADPLQGLIRPLKDTESQILKAVKTSNLWKEICELKLESYF
jgi:adenosylhomocysteinase